MPGTPTRWGGKPPCSARGSTVDPWCGSTTAHGSTPTGTPMKCPRASSGSTGGHHPRSSSTSETRAPLTSVSMCWRTGRVSSRHPRSRGCRDETLPVLQHMLTLVRGARVSLVLEDRGWCPPVEPELALGHFIGVPVGVLPCAVVDPHQGSTVEPLAEHGGFPPHRVGVPGIPEPRRVGRNGHRKRERIDAQQGCEHFVSQALPGSRPVHVLSLIH